VNRVGPALCLTSPYPAAPTGTDPVTAVDPPRRTLILRPSRQPGGEVLKPCLGALAGHLVLPPAERPES